MQKCQVMVCSVELGMVMRAVMMTKMWMGVQHTMKTATTTRTMRVIRRRFLSFSCSFSVDDEIEKACRKRSGGGKRGKRTKADGGSEKEGKVEVEYVRKRRNKRKFKGGCGRRWFEER